VSHSDHKDLLLKSVKHEKVRGYFCVTCCAMSERALLVLSEDTLAQVSRPSDKYSVEDDMADIFTLKFVFPTFV
jgi:hypothetical protein